MERRIKLNDKQDEFIFSQARNCGYGGGWGNGKTLAGCIKTFMHLENNRDALAFVGRQDATDLRDSTMSDFREWFGDRLVEIRGERRFEYKPTNSAVIFRHADDLTKLTNINLSYFWLDQAEELPEASFNFLRGRLRRNIKGLRQGNITFNMEGHNWIWKKFKNANEVDFHLVEGTTLENQDNLPDDYIKGLEALPDKVYKRYVLGNWDVFEGQIFTEYDERLHVIKPFVVPKNWNRFVAIDHGLTNPTAVLWGAVDYDDNLYIYDCYYQAGELVSHHAEQIKAKTGNDKISIYLIDPSTNNREGISGRSVRKEYTRCGVITTPADNDVRAGINRVAEYLRVNPKRINPQTERLGSPQLFIFNTPETGPLREELPQYKWKEVKGKVGVENPPEQPTKNNDHAVDALRYMIMYLWKPNNTPKEIDNKRIIATKDPYFEEAKTMTQEDEEGYLEI